MHYLYVKGFSESVFTISTQVIRKQNDTVHTSYLQLQRDLYLDIYLKKGEILQFEIDLQVKENITLRLIPIQGRFDIFVGVDKFLPPKTNETAIWSSIGGNSYWNQHRRHRNGLWILDTDPNYPNDQLSFYGTIQLRNDTEFIPEDDVTYHFQVTYHTDSSMHLL
jgi:hypothetical protein